jgi:trans-2-enoyl-CoA reductase
LRTVNVVRRESAVEAVRALGGDAVLVDGDDFGKRVREATGNATIRLAIDAVGGASTGRLAHALGDGGVLVNYGAMSGEACEISPASLVFRELTVRGFWLAKWYRTATSAQRAALFGELAGLIAAGQLSARVQATYGIDGIKQAVAAAAAGERDGKILVLPNG